MKANKAQRMKSSHKKFLSFTQNGQTQKQEREGGKFPTGHFKFETCSLSIFNNKINFPKSLS